MRLHLTALATLTLLLLAAPAPADKDETGLAYKVELEKNNNNERRLQLLSRDGKLYIRIQFKIKRIADGGLVTNVDKSQIVIREDGKRVKDLEIYQPATTEPLTAVMAMDISGSMGENDGLKMKQAQRAAGIFLDKLPDKSDLGLILFDHLMRVTAPPAYKSDSVKDHRDKLRGMIQEAKPLGGTAYLDAVVESLKLLHAAKGRKAVLLMTDGVDLNSVHSLQEVVDLAKKAGVPVYTIGVGEPGKNEPVTNMLVLDRSGSMLEPADDNDEKSKIDALHEAASRFADLMRVNARTSLLAFSDRPGLPGPFTADKSALKKQIRALKAGGETALFDAAYDALETLLADKEETVKARRQVGKRAVVLLTDGIDNKSHRREEDVIQLAKEAKVPLYLLGLGRTGELDEKTMKYMAEETGGKYYPARNKDDLLKTFENLSILLHDDGIDEASLRRLAEDTGGKYYLARNVEDLRLKFEDVATELDSTYTATFPSVRPQYDGTARDIEVGLVDPRTGKRLSESKHEGYEVHGVVLAEMHPSIYLGLLAVLVGLLAVPVGLRRLNRVFGGS
jgi:VWFA-related protein